MLQTRIQILTSLLITSTLANNCVSKAPTCVCDQDNTIISCNQRDTKLDKVPKEIPKSVSSLYLDSNNLEDLSGLGDLDNLKFLSVSHNKIESIEYDVFDNMDSLQTLKLSHNQLKSLDDDVFEWNPLKLEIIDLSHNNFTFVQHFLFYDMERLQTIDLSYNQISFIHPHAFQQLKELRQLDLSNNHLSTFTPTWVQSMGANGVSEINLYSNPWSCDCGMQNAIKFISDASNSWFTTIKNSEIYCNSPLISANDKRENIEDNETLRSVIRRMDTNSDFKLECSAPQITGISKSSTIKAGKTVLLRCIAEGLPKPTIAWIAPNEDVYRLNSDNFKGIKVSEEGNLTIKNLKISDTGEYICQATSNSGRSGVDKDNVIQVGTTLTVIDDIDENNKETYNRNSDLVDGEKKTSQNTNENCPPECECSGDKIDCSMSVAGSKLTALPRFEPKTKKILGEFASKYYLINNNIQRIEESICKDFRILTEFKIDNNKINYIDKEAFRGCNSMNVISLRNNRLTSIKSGVFSDLNHIETIILDENQITYLKSHTFTDLPKLRWLYLRYGTLKVIEPDTFKRTPKLEFIHFEKNKISNFNTNFLDQLVEQNSNSEDYTRLFAKDNPFRCDCTMDAFYSKLDDYEGLLDKEDLVCDWPPRNKDKSFDELEDKDMICTEGDPDLPLSFIEDQSNDTQGWGILSGTLLGIILTVVGVLLYKKYKRGNMMNVNYNDFARTSYQEISNALNSENGDFRQEERQGLTAAGGGAGTEAFM